MPANKEAKTMEQLSKQLGEMFELVEKQSAQIANFGEVETRLGTQIDAKNTIIDELLAEKDEQKSRLDELEKKTGRLGHSTGDVIEFKSIGEQFIDSDQYKSLLGANGEIVKRNCDPAQVKGIMSPQARMKALSSDALSAGALVDPMRVAEIIRPPERAFRIRDIITVATTTSNAIEYAEEVGFANLTTVLTAQAASGQAEIVVENIEGFYAHSVTAYRQSVNVGGEEHKVLSLVTATKTITLDGNLAGVQAIGVTVTSDTFSPTPELHEKPQMDLSYDLKDVSVKTLAHWIPAARQILADAGSLRSQIDGRLIYGLGLAEEEQILYGDGGDSLAGIMTNANIQEYDWSSGASGDSKIDAIRRGMTLARIAEYQVEGVLLNPVDWEDIELAKGSDKHYIWLIVQNGVESRLFRTPVVDTTAIRAGEALTGAFRLGATLYDREEAMIRVAEQHENFFVKNMVVILAELRAALAVFRPEAFVKINFDSAP